jgi:hypothetical protein
MQDTAIPKKIITWKAVSNKTKTKIKNEMASHCPEVDMCKRIEKQRKELGGLEAYCRNGQGQPWAVDLSGMEI